MERKILNTEKSALGNLISGGSTTSTCISSTWSPQIGSCLTNGIYTGFGTTSPFGIGGCPAAIPPLNGQIQYNGAQPTGIGGTYPQGTTASLNCNQGWILNRYLWGAFQMISAILCIYISPIVELIFRINNLRTFYVFPSFIWFWFIHINGKKSSVDKDSTTIRKLGRVSAIYFD